MGDAAEVLVRALKVRICSDNHRSANDGSLCVLHDSRSEGSDVLLDKTARRASDT